MADDGVLRYLSLISQLGLLMITSILIGFGLGYWIDKRFALSPLCTFLGLAVGILSGFTVVYKTILREIEKK